MFIISPSWAIKKIRLCGDSVRRHLTRNDRGSVTIEATISLVSFIFVIVTIFSFISICRAQVLIQIAINEAAKEISQYSYLYKITGLKTYEQKLDEAGNEAAQKTDAVIVSTDKVMDSMGDLYDFLGSMSGSNSTPGKIDSATYSEAKDKVNNLSGSAGDLNTDIENLMSDPKGLMMGFSALAGQDVVERLKTDVIGALAKAISKKNFELKNQEKITIVDADQRLRGLGVVNGLSGLDFTHSIIFQNGTSDDIKITVVYQIKTIQLLPIEDTATFCQTASTRGWLYGDAAP